VEKRPVTRELIINIIDHFFSLFTSVSIMRDSIKIAKVLFLCSPFAWFRATANG